MFTSRAWFRLCLPGLAAACLLLPAAARAEGPAFCRDVWLPVAPARGPAWLMSGIGRAHSAITTRSGEAQRYFDQGLALLLEGWPAEADRSFARVEQLDPQCAMAQWGLAMAALSPARRDSAVAQARRLAAGASARERDYVEAVALLAAGSAAPGGPAGAAEGYRQVLRRIVASSPAEMPARLLLAQSLVSGYGADGTPGPGTSEAIALCEVVLHKDPSSAGAHHTLAHAYESSPWPDKGAREAGLFVKAAPAVAHAHHLAGRLALRTNHGDDAIRALEASATVDEAYMNGGDETSEHASGPYSRNLALLAIAYTQQGRYRDAMRTATRLIDWSRQPGEAEGATALDGRLAALRVMVRFRRWTDVLDGRSLPDDGGFEVMKPWRHYVMGRAWLNRRQLNRAWSELIALDRSVRRLRPQLPMTAALRPLQDRQVLALQVAPLDLKGRILAREGMAEEAMAALKQGLALERQAAALDPRLYLLPMEEALGDAALDQNRWNDAATAYRAALAREPSDGIPLIGLARALDGAGKKEEAAQVRSQLAAQWAHADSIPLPAPAMNGAATVAPAVATGAAPAPGTPAAIPALSATAPIPAGTAPAPVAAVAVAAVAQHPATAPRPWAAPTPVPAPPDPWAAKLKKTKVNGVQLAYVDVGKGQPIVLIHGALSDYRQWAPQIEALSKHYRVIAYSRRYHYPNPPADDHADYSYEVNEADLVGLIRGLHLGKVHLLGHGYGGFVATLAARDHPEMVRTLMLAEPGVYSMIPGKKDRRAAIEGLQAAAASSGEAARGGDLEGAAKRFYGVIQGNAAAYDSLPEPQRRIMRDNAGTLLLGIEAPPSFPCEQVHRLVTRTLLIEGDATPRNELAAAEGLDRCLPNRFRARIPGASRVVNRGNPDAFNQAVSEFIEAPEDPTHLPADEP